MSEHWARWVQLLSQPRRLILVAVLLALPTLTFGLQSDDYLLEQQVRSDPLQAFAFFPDRASLAQRRAQGVLGWWASDTFSLRLLRPLTAATHALDFGLWPNAAWLMHLENVLIYASIVWLAALAYRQLLASAFEAQLAATFYAFGTWFPATMGWISSRNTLLATLLGLLTFWLHVRARSQRSLVCALAAWLAFVAALLAGESAGGALGWLCGYALCLDPAGARTGIARVLPHLAAWAAYVILYQALGYGAHSSGWYLNASQQPALVLHNLLTAVPIYLATLIVTPYATFTALLPSGSWTLALVSVALLAPFTPVLLARLRTSREARFFASAAVMSVVPLTLTMPQERLGGFVAFASCGLLSSCLAESVRANTCNRRQELLFVLHTFGALACFVPWSTACLAPGLGGGTRELCSALAADPGRRTVLLNAPSGVTPLPVGAMFAREGKPQPLFANLLYAGSAPYDLRRVGPLTLDMHVARGWVHTPLERLMRDVEAEPFVVGQVLRLPGLSARVLAINPRGEPTAIRFEFAAALDDPSWLWLRFDGRRVVRWTPPVIGTVQHMSAAAVLF